MSKNYAEKPATQQSKNIVCARKKNNGKFVQFYEICVNKLQ